MAERCQHTAHSASRFERTRHCLRALACGRPRGNGSEATEKIRASFNTARVPVLPHARRRSPRAAGFRSALAVPALALVIFLAVHAIFYLPLGRFVLDPASSTAFFDDSVTVLQRWPADARRDVLVLGDSRIYAGLDPIAADAAAPHLRFLNAGIPGTTPRCWDVYDRAIDPHADRFRAIVIPVDTYADDTSAIGSLDAADHVADLGYIVDHVDFREILGVAGSFDQLDLRIEAAAGLFLRGPLLAPDVRSFLLDPLARLRVTPPASAQRFSPRGTHPSAANLAGLRVNQTGNVVGYPAGTGDTARSLIDRQILAPPERSAEYARYRERWLGSIVARYRRANVPVIFVRIPTRPTHRSVPPPPSGSLVRFVTEGGARLVPQLPYVALEMPAFFADGDHLNRAGGQRFSRILGRDVERAITVPRGTAVGPTRAAAVTAPRLDGIAGGAAPAPAARSSSVRARVSAALRIGTPLQFQSFEFSVFFLAVLALFYALPRRGRPLLLAIASYYFYARWNAAFVPILAAITLSDYAIARALEGARGGHRRALLAAGVAVNLAFLATFKYLDFLTASVASLAGLHGDPWFVRLVVPVGISFHTFQSISYLVDVARGRMRAIRSLLDYAVYIAFFPQLLSGPIVRAERFFRELSEWQGPAGADVESGLRDIVLGLVKKFAIADAFAPSADAYFAAPLAHPGTLAAWSASFAFAMQIYFDFSGYSDIAIGCARLLGFAFPENFHRPYFAATITIFWRRWNMTLSAWLRDYLYVPLGGNRHGTLLTYRNLALTMLLAGLWHGANWTFVAWGGYHGALLAIERCFSRGAAPARGVARAGRTLLTFVFVVIGWVLFRAANLSDALVTLRAMLVPSAGEVPSLATWPIFLVLCAAAIGAAQECGRPWSRWQAVPMAGRAGALCVLLLGFELLAPAGGSVPFIYFKF